MGASGVVLRDQESNTDLPPQTYFLMKSAPAAMLSNMTMVTVTMMAAELEDLSTSD